MKYLLDTDTCIYWLKGNEDIEKKALKVGLARIFISFITLSELYYGAYKSRKVEQNLANISALKDKLNIVESNVSKCEVFGNLKAILEK